MFVNLLRSLAFIIPLQALTSSTTNSSLESTFGIKDKMFLTTLILLIFDVLKQSKY